MGIPSIIKQFFSAKGGRSLLVKGNSGTGKTTFSLMCMEDMANINNSFYFTTRVSDEALYSHFEWLKKKEWHDRILDASRMLLKTILPPLEEKEDGKNELVEASKSFLQIIYGDISSSPVRIEKKMLRALNEECEIPELQSLYYRVETSFPKETFVVLDSLNGLSERYGVPMSRILTVLQKDLVECTHINLLAVVEEGEAHHLDYIADGVVTFRKVMHEGRRYRVMLVEKLRGVEISKPAQVFTLAEGRFNHIPAFPEREIPPRILQDVEADGMYSTGIPELDSILGGGFPRGSNVLVEFISHVPHSLLRYLTETYLCSFLKVGRGVMVVPFTDMCPEDYVASAEKAVSSDAVAERLRIAEKVFFEKEQEYPYILPLTFEDAVRDYDNWRREMERLARVTGQPVLELIALETQEARLGVESYKIPLSLSSEIARREGHLTIRFAKPGLGPIVDRVSNYSNIHIKIGQIDGALVLYCEKPHSMMYGVIMEDRLRLVPLV